MKEAKFDDDFFISPLTSPPGPTAHPAATFFFPNPSLAPLREEAMSKAFNPPRSFQRMHGRLSACLPFFSLLPQPTLTNGSLFLYGMLLGSLFNFFFII